MNMRILFFLFWAFLSISCSRNANLKVTDLPTEEESVTHLQMKKISAKVDYLEHEILVLQDKVKRFEEQKKRVKLSQGEGPVIPVLRIATGKESLKGPNAKGQEDMEMTYKNLYHKFNSGDCQDTVLEFDLFAKKYPDSSLADNAQYWIGECYFLINEHKLAIAEFEKVEQKYPQGNKVPDSWLRIGMSQEALGNPLQAKMMYQKVMTKYPKTEAANKAKNRLDQIPNQGGS